MLGKLFQRIPLLGESVIAMTQVKESKLSRCVHERSSLEETYATDQQNCQEFLEMPFR